MQRKPLGFQTWQTAGRKQETGVRKQDTEDREQGTGNYNWRENAKCCKISIGTQCSLTKKVSFSEIIVYILYS